MAICAGVPSMGDLPHRASVYPSNHQYQALCFDLEGTFVGRWLAERGVAAFILKVCDSRQTHYPPAHSHSEDRCCWSSQTLQAHTCTHLHTCIAHCTTPTTAPFTTTRRSNATHGATTAGRGCFGVDPPRTWSSSGGSPLVWRLLRADHWGAVANGQWQPPRGRWQL